MIDVILCRGPSRVSLRKSVLQIVVYSQNPLQVAMSYCEIIQLDDKCHLGHLATVHIYIYKYINIYIYIFI